VPVEGAPTEDVVSSVEAFVDRSLSTLLWQSVLVLAFAVVIAIAVGWVLAGRALAPLQTVTQTAQRVSARGLHERIALTGPQDEVKELADTFDAMLDRLDRAFDAQRHFVGNASHELRTPLAITRTLLEVAAADPESGDAVRRLSGPLLATNERSERLIDGLLLMARSEQQVVNRRPVDMADLAHAAVADAKAEATGRGIALRCEADPTPTLGEPLLLEQAVANLVQNAVRHNVDGGWADVRVELIDDAAVVTVANTGPTVAPHEATEVFEPFRRLAGRVATDVPGSGLGLSIVRAVAHAHGGEVTAAPRDGGGLVVTLRLPVRAARPGAP
jgi:signal transduction histidine kinase